MTKEFEMQIIITKEVFYDEIKRFGIYGADTVDYNREVEKNKYGNFSMQGNTRRLAEGETYKVKFEGTYAHPKFGNYYKIIKVHAEQLDTLDAQDKFLREVLSNAHFKSLKNAYPKEKLVDFVLADKVNVKDTKGIKDKALIKIKAVIQENMKLAVLIAKLSDLNISSTKLYKILDHFGNPDAALDAIQKNIYLLCDIKSLGFKTVDAIALHRGDDPNNEQRVHACIKYTLNEDANNGHTWSIRSHLLTTCSDLLNMPMNQIELVLSAMNSHAIYQNGDVVAIADIRRKEMSVLEELIRIRDSYTPPNLKDIEFSIRQTEAEQGYAFTNEQFKAIVEGSQHGVMILNGVAGSGKSASVKGLIDSLDGVSYMTCALSGKAVNVLAQRGIQASTIHRMLKMKDGQFVHNANNPLPYEVVVVDEVSMINIPLMLSVLKAVYSGSKLIIVGDSGQLPAIGYGDVLRDLLATDFFARFELTQVHRQAAKSGILKLANSIRIGEQVFPFNSSGQETFGELQDQTVISYANKENIVPDLLNIARAYKERITCPEDMYDFQLWLINQERLKCKASTLADLYLMICQAILSRNG
jgi:exodeoxyribonuclease V alpha subunit